MRILKPYLLCVFFISVFFGISAQAAISTPAFPRPIDSYTDDATSSLWEKLTERVKAEPFNLIATGIFFLAIC
ncbi:MAG: hypothetical protein ABI615_09555, partial [Chthoniobacterales bacterium]